MNLPVAAAWLQNDKGEILICLRKRVKARGGYWEFPGGKIEEGESGQQALVRELKEELDISITPGKIRGRTIYSYPDITIELILIDACNPQGIISMTDHDSYIWVKPQELKDYNLAPADLLLLKKLPPC